MKLLNLCLFLFVIFGCSHSPPIEVPLTKDINIVEINPNKWTTLTRKDLEQLFKVYDLSPILFTKEIRIESRVIPHSHPVLTLNTRYAEEPFKLLSMFIHEQLHWWLESQSAAFLQAKEELKKLFPVLPDSGLAKDAHSTYLHLSLCTLEYELLVHYLGTKQANLILKDLIYKDKIYPWIYKEVYKNFKDLKTINEKYGLRPAF